MSTNHPDELSTEAMAKDLREAHTDPQHPFADLDDIADRLQTLEAENQGHRDKWGGPSISAHPFMIEQVRQNNQLMKEITELKESNKDFEDVAPQFVKAVEENVELKQKIKELTLLADDGDQWVHLVAGYKKEIAELKQMLKELEK